MFGITWFSREFFDALIWFVLVTGVIGAAVRLYQDFTRPLPPSGRSSGAADDDDTAPHPPQTS